MRTCLPLALAACSGTRAPVSRYVPPPPRVAGDRVRSSTWLLPPLEPVRRLAPAPDGRAVYAAGGVRVTLGPQGAQLAPVAAMQPVLRGGATPDGTWWFALADGTLMKSDGPLGTLARPVAIADAAPPALPATAEGAVAENSSDVEIVRRTVREAYPLARIADPNTLLLASGALAFCTPAAFVLARIQPAAGDTIGFESAGEIAVTGAAAATGCTAQAWGARVLFACPEAQSESVRAAGLAATLRAYAASATVPAALVGDRPVRGPWVLSRDGRSLTARGTCPDLNGVPVHDEDVPVDTQPVTRVCEFDDERGWHEWSIPGDARVLDVYGDAALVLIARDEGPVLARYDIDSARVSALPLSDPAAEVLRAGFTPGGSVVVLAQMGTDRTRRVLTAVARPGTALVLQPVGFMARDLAMSDALRGVAVGRTAGEIAVTTDGAAHWTRVRVPVDGDATRIVLETSPPRVDEVRRTGEVVECGPDVCRAAGRIAHSWGDAIEGTVGVE